MNGMKSLLLVSVTVLMALLASASAWGQYNQGDAVSRVQRAVERRMIREIGGSSPSVTFERRTDYVQASGNAMQLTGRGYYRRDATDPGSSFQYRGTVDRNSGRVSDAQYTLGPAAVTEDGPQGQWAVQAIQAVQAQARDSIAQQQRGDVTFNQDVQVQRTSRSQADVRGTGVVTRRNGRARTFTYSAMYNLRSHRVEQLQVSRLSGGDTPYPGTPASGGTYNVSLRGPNNGFVSVGWGGNIVQVDRAGSQAPSPFRLVDRNGGALQNGDTVSIYTGNGWLSAERGGGGNLLASGRDQGAWESFTVVKLDSASGAAIRSGDRVAFRTQSGQYWTAENGGGSKINCKGTSVGPWEAFFIDFR